MTNSVAEIEDARALLVIGSNTTENHPIIALRMKAAVRKGAKLIVADPRKIPLTKFATLWLRHKPGTDAVLLNAIMHSILEKELEDRYFVEHRTEGFDEFRESLASFTPEFGEEVTGVSAADIKRAAEIYGSAERAGVYYAMGITQHVMGTNNVHAVGNLAMLTGNLGKYGSGVNPLRGQNNVQGCCDMGCLPNYYPGYQLVGDEEVRKKFEQAWGAELSATVGMPASEMTQAMIDKKLRGLYIFGENPALSDPNTNHAVKGFSSLDFLVVQDIFETETTRLADVVLPGASFAEKTGTFTSSERRVQLVRQAVSPPGQARTDLEIINEILCRMNDAEVVTPDPVQVFAELSGLWQGMSGMSYDRLGREGLQWPCPSADHAGTPFLFKEGFLRPGGKALFSVVPHVVSKELPDKEYPFLLTTGRELFHYHTGTMTRRSTGLDAVAPKPYIQVNPADAAKNEIEDGQSVTVTSRRGRFVSTYR